jgi:hypothetical protein
MQVSTQVERGVVLDDAGLLAAFGIGDLAAIEETGGRVLRYSDKSSLGCPMHDVTLKPDSCSSCRLLGGWCSVAGSSVTG